MSTTTFLQHILADGGHYCLFAARAKDERKSQQFFESFEAMDTRATQLDEQGYDVYYAMASFERAGTRTADNAAKLRSFFLDLDCGKEKAAAVPPKGYPTQQAAVKAVRVFCQTHQLPKPTIVNSGRGLHVYWTMDEDLATSDWHPLALRFKQMCLNHGLIIDRAVPADAARVLRYPGTRNYKDSPPKAVTIMADMAPIMSLENFTAILDHYLPEGLVDKPKSRSQVNDPLMNSLMGNATSRFRTILEKSVQGKGCAQIDYIARNQADVEEPLWRAGLSIAVNCLDGDKAIHVISRKHPQYDPDETADKARRTAGPYHCASFAAIDPSKCKDCPHKGKITSPIQLGKEIIRAQDEDNVVFDRPEQMESVGLQQYTIPPYPRPYFRGKNGGVYVETENRDGDKVEMLVYEHDMYVIRRGDDPEEGAVVVVRVHLPYDGVREFTVPLKDASKKDKLIDHLAKNHVVATTAAQWEALMSYTLKWVSNLTHSSAADVSRRQFGWVDKDFTAFTLGRALVFKDRVELNPPSAKTATLFPMFEPHGSLDVWKENLEFFNQPGFESYQYIIGTAFGSVLTAMTAIKGSIFNFHTEDSGYGKTTVLFAAASLWADPQNYVRFERDTLNDKMNFAEVVKDLPLYLDEMTNMDPRQCSDFIYQIPSGKQRGRLAQSANSSRWRGDPWSLICVTTANSSLLAKVNSYKDAPRAEMQRVIEYSPRKLNINKEDTDRLAKQIQDNYGHAAIPYLQFVMNNVEEIKALLAKVQANIDSRIGLTAQNRFWSAQAACVITGLLVAKKMKLVNYDTKALIEWVVGYLSSYRIESAAIAPGTAGQVVAEYYMEHFNDFLRIRGKYDLRKDDTRDVLDHLVVPEAMPRNSMLGRLETDTNTLYLLPKPFKAWCSSRQVDFNRLVRDLKRGETRASYVSKRMGKGTKVNLPPVQTLRLEGAQWLLGLDDEDEQAT